uniref:non-ribosomal peptide synthetase n=1 Tax=Herbidospora sakaeratensis TaxID=564415 RepID=UPI00078036F4|nr:thioester reductase domain-containing protein [Herbidospora sakaeratensis]
MSKLSERMARVAARRSGIPPRAPDADAPLAPSQERLWFLDQAGFDGDRYLCWAAHELTGDLDVPRMRRAIDALAARHESLRTAIVVRDGVPYQHVLDAVEVPFSTEGTIEEFLSYGFDLARAPMMRALLIPHGDGHVLAMCWHHIVCDGETTGILFDELYALYRGESLLPVQVQYPDYAAWLSTRDTDAADRAFWKERLDGVSGLLDLPLDRPRPARPTFDGERRSVVYPEGFAGELRGWAQANRTTVFMVVLAALNVVLARLADTDDVVVGTPVSDRELPELERTAGMFVNTVALRTRLTGNPTLREVVRLARETTMTALDHRTLPFDSVVELTGGRRDLSHNPIFQVMLVTGEPGGAIEVAPGLTGRAYLLAAPPARFDLTVVVEGDGVHLDYATDLFDAASVDAIGHHMVAVLRATVDDADQGVWDVPLQTRSMGAVSSEAPEWEIRPSDEPAVITDAETVTYRQLLRRAASVESSLAGAARGSVVGVRLPAGPDAVAAIVGILHAGCAYLPLDPAHPPERAEQLLAAANAVGVVDHDGFHPRDHAPVEPSSLAYVIFTSGSTGAPKGVAVGHDSLRRFTKAFTDVHGFTSADRVLMIPPLTFDASVGDLFPVLSTGGALVLHDEPARLDADALLAFVERHGITAVDTAASLWRRWADELAGRTVDWPVRLMMVGGESVPASALAAWLAATGTPLVNHYGPTEATVCATTHTAVASTDLLHLPIGAELPHVRAHVVDGHGGLAPDNVYGELHLAGDCLAWGYLGQPAMTADRFVPDPFSGAPGARMYRTGDLVRRRLDGTFEFAGRRDRQLKVRGHRIEPGEVEAALTAHPGVRDAHVTAVGDRLVAFVAGEPDLRAHLRERLPDYLVPDVFVALETVPRTSHGKVDTAALPEVTVSAPYEAPRTPAEQAVADVWSVVVAGDRRVGRRDNFFELGGHSLLAARVLAALKDRLGVALPLRALFETADLAELAATIEGTHAVSDEPDLLAEAVLPDDVRVTVPRTRSGITVLLTGATGFLGAHLAARLAPVSELLCLVRAGSPAAAEARVRAALAAQGLPEARVVGIPGDLGSPRFGLSEEAFRELADRVDVVCHNGGLINFAEPYHRLKDVNVGGTLEVLRLAALGGGVPVHHVSTLGVHLGKAYQSRRITEADVPEDPTGLGGGYNQTKWVADRLAARARERGVPVSIHRPARIGGDSRTGWGNDGDYFSRLLATMTRLGMAPDLPFDEDVSPVDHVADGIVHHVLHGAGEDHHYFNEATISYAEIAEALGVRLVAWDEWRAAVHDGLPDLPLAAFVTELPEERPVFPRPWFDCSRTRRVLTAAGITCPPADRALIRRYVEAMCLTS